MRSLKPPGVAFATLLGALVDLPQQQGSGCAALKIAMVAVTAAYAIALALLRPSNTPQDAVVVSVNAAMGAAVAIAVLLSPTVGAELAFAQGIAAVSTAVLPLLVVVLSGRALRWLRELLQRGNVPLEPVALVGAARRRLSRHQFRRLRRLTAAVNVAHRECGVHCAAGGLQRSRRRFRRAAPGSCASYKYRSLKDKTSIIWTELA